MAFLLLLAISAIASIEGNDQYCVQYKGAFLENYMYALEYMPLAISLINAIIFIILKFKSKCYTEGDYTAFQNIQQT